MKKNLNGRIALIIAVLVVFIYGIFGIPSGVTGQALLASMTKRIHLGLDLRGGAHLILQVVVKEAVSAETDSAAGRIQQDLKSANLTFSQVIKPDPLKPDGSGKPEIIQIEGTNPAKANDIRSLLDSKYSNEYDVSGGSDTSFTVTMKPQVELALEKKTVQQAIETIRDRVDTLGVSEPVIQEYGLGDNQILVELPGIEDLDRVKSIIQSTARLEIHPVVGGPYQDEQSALASVGGALPPDEEMLHYSGMQGSDSDSVYVLQRVPIVAGSDFRSADPSTSENGLPFGPLHAHQRSRRSLLRLHQHQCGPRHGGCSRRPRARGRQHQERYPRHGRNRRRLLGRTKSKCSRRCCAPARCRPRSTILRTAPWAPRSAQTPSGKA